MISGDTIDHSDYKHSSTVFGTPELVKNKLNEEGEAIQFVGEEYIEVTSHGSLLLTDKITISVWVKQSESNNIFLHKMVNESVGSAYSLDNNNGNVRFFLNRSAGSFGVTSTEKLVENEWVHVLGTYDGSTMNLYINGELEETKDFTTTISSDNTGNIGIGRYLGSTSASVNASYDEIRLYNKVLSSSDIQELSDSIIITSLGIFQIESTVDLYPNPVVSGQEINVDLRSDLDVDVISIFDSNGRLIKTIEETEKISTADMAKGLYQIIIQSNGKNYSSRLILN